jgi:hypothetical protein
MKNLITILTGILILQLISLNGFSQGALNTYRFDGFDDGVEVGTVDFQFDEEITVMGWIKWNIDPKTGYNWANIITNNSEYSGDNGQFWIQHDQNNNKIEFALQLESGRQYIWAKSIVKQDEWMHFAATYDGRDAIVY